MKQNIEQILEHAKHWLVSNGKNCLLTIRYNHQTSLWEAGYWNYMNNNNFEMFAPATASSFTGVIMDFAKIFVVPTVYTDAVLSNEQESLAKIVSHLPKILKDKDGTIYQLCFVASHPDNKGNNYNWCATYIHPVNDVDGTYEYCCGWGETLRNAILHLRKIYRN